MQFDRMCLTFVLQSNVKHSKAGPAKMLEWMHLALMKHLGVCDRLPEDVLPAVPDLKRDREGNQFPVVCLGPTNDVFLNAQRYVVFE
jgi:hypothetical protein